MMESIDQMSDTVFFLCLGLGLLTTAVIIMWVEIKELKHENRSLRRRLYGRGAIP